MSPQVTAAILIFIFLQNDMIISRNISSKLPNLLLMMLRLLGIVVGAYDFFGSQYVQRYTSQLIMYVLYTEIGHSVRLRV